MSTCEALNSLIGENVLEHLMNARSPARQGNHDAIMAPHNVYRAKGEDKWVSIAVATDEQWNGLRAAMGDPKWSRDRTFASTYGRWRQRDRIDPLLQQWTIRRTPQELTELLQARGVPAFPSYNAEELFSDQHLRARESVTEIKHPVLGERLAVSPPWNLSETPATITKTAPLLGEDNQYVLCDLLGLSEDEVSRLAENGVVY